MESLKYVAFKIGDVNPTFTNEVGIFTTPPHLAASLGNFESFKFILDNVVDKNPSGKNGITPFSLAAEFGHFKICQILIDIIEGNLLLAKVPRNHYLLIHIFMPVFSTAWSFVSPTFTLQHFIIRQGPGFKKKPIRSTYPRVG